MGIAIFEIIGTFVRFSFFYLYSLITKNDYKDFDYYSGHKNNATDRGAIEFMNLLVGILSIIVLCFLIYLISLF